MKILQRTPAGSYKLRVTEPLILVGYRLDNGWQPALTVRVENVITGHAFEIVLDDNDLKNLAEGREKFAENFV